MFRPLEAIIRSRFGYPEAGEEFGWLAVIQDTPTDSLHYNTKFLKLKH